MCVEQRRVTPSTGSPMTVPQQASANSGWIHDGGVTYHVPHYMATRYSARQDAKPNILLAYGNGPVLVAPKMYLIFWGFAANGDPNKMKKPLLKNYAKNIGATAYDNIYTQYYQIIRRVGQTFVANPRNQGSKTTFWADNTNAIPAHPTDSQVAAEALQGVNHFGCDPNVRAWVREGTQPQLVGLRHVVLRLPQRHDVGRQAGCRYTNLPYIPDAGPSCGANYISPPTDETGADEGVDDRRRPRVRRIGHRSEPAERLVQQPERRKSRRHLRVGNPHCKRSVQC